MVDRLAVALEPEMPRFDHPGVHGPHRDLVDLLALHVEKVGDADGRPLVSGGRA